MFQRTKYSLHLIILQNKEIIYALAYYCGAYNYSRSSGKILGCFGYECRRYRIFDTNLFDITYIQNKGAAFSLLSGKLSLLSIISVAFCICAVIYWIKKKPTHPLLCTSITMMFAGAFGNAIDRIFRGFVIDYIQTSFINFPVFNIADIGITVGAILLVVYFIWFDKEDKNADVKN